MTTLPKRGLMTEPTAFDGRSDYGPFIEADTPAGRPFTGAEDIKTEQQSGIYGGTAGEAYDQRHHLARDTFDSNELKDAVVHSVMVIATHYLRSTSEKRRRCHASNLALPYQSNKMCR